MVSIEVIGSWTSFGSRTAARTSARSIVPSSAHGIIADRGAGDDRVAGALAAERVDVGRADDLAAARDVGHEPDEVAHRAARDEQAGLAPEELGGSLLERADGRVLAEDVVADLGLGHRPAHGRRGQRDGVGPEVDHAVPAGPGGRCRVAHRAVA